MPLLQGADGVDGLDDIATASVVYIDGLDIWAHGAVEGRGQVKARLKAWLERYECGATGSAAVATPDSNKVSGAALQLVQLVQLLALAAVSAVEALARCRFGCRLVQRRC
jgi:hypothetical protein